jgi:hypothetical protein
MSRIAGRSDGKSTIFQFAKQRCDTLENLCDNLLEPIKHEITASPARGFELWELVVQPQFEYLLSLPQVPIHWFGNVLKSVQ